MAWKYSGKIIRAGKAWKDNDGVQHPSNWSIWDDDTKKSKGLTWEDDPAPFDNRFYWSAGNAKSLTDTLWVDEDGKAINDPLTGKQGKTKGLKTVAIETAKAEAASQLAPYDWYVTRNVEKSIAIPNNITTFRDAVRTACAAIETKITNASDLAAFMALYDTPVDSNKEPTGKPPINDWPDAI